MKNIKKLLSIVMVLAMVLSLGVSAFAATTPPQDADVTLPDEYEGHTMVAYKIFKGRQNTAQENEAGDSNPGDFGLGSADLGVTDWADGVNVNKLLTDLATKYGGDKFNTSMTAVEAAKAISDLNIQSDTAKAHEFAKLVAGCVSNVGTVTFGPEKTNLAKELSSGYWIICDETKNAPEDFSYSSYLLQVVGGKDLKLSKKVDKPTLEKKVNGVDSVVAKGENGEVVGDVLTFTLTATVPGNYADYETYYMQFVDTMSKGLTLNAESFSVSLERYSGEGAEAGFKAVGAPKDVYTEITPEAQADGTHFTYTITDLKRLFENAQAGDHVVLTYTAVLNDEAEFRNLNTAELHYSNNPNTMDHGGTTPPDTVAVFTLFLDVNKIKSDNSPLDGATFKLSKKNEETGAWQRVGEAPVVGLNADGQPAGPEEEVVSYTVDFDRLGAGFYKLEETVVPAGYNKAPDIYFEVVAESQKEAENPQMTELKVYMTDAEGKHTDETPQIKVEEKGTDGYLHAGTMDTDVVNTNGMELPETGGIGTTIFYVVGAVLVVGAVILLVTRKRVSGEEK